MVQVAPNHIDMVMAETQDLPEFLVPSGLRHPAGQDSAACVSLSSIDLSKSRPEHNTAQSLNSATV